MCIYQLSSVKTSKESMFWLVKSKNRHQVKLKQPFSSQHVGNQPNIMTEHATDKLVQLIVPEGADNICKDYKLMLTKEDVKSILGSLRLS